jgi:Protein of unknown function (DUF2845)
MKTSTACLTAILLFVPCTPSWPAQSFHCGPRIIARGDPAEKLLEFRGEPTNIERRYAQRTAADRNGRLYPGFIEDVLVEVWTYNFGRYQLMRRVRLENGFVTDVRHLGYGY